jgi:hypothetical protein
MVEAMVSFLALDLITTPQSVFLCRWLIQDDIKVSVGITFYNNFTDLFSVVSVGSYCYDVIGSWRKADRVVSGNVSCYFLIIYFYFYPSIGVLSFSSNTLPSRTWLCANA